MDLRLLLEKFPNLEYEEPDEGSTTAIFVSPPPTPPETEDEEESQS